MAYFSLLVFRFVIKILKNFLLKCFQNCISLFEKHSITRKELKWLSFLSKVIVTSMWTISTKHFMHTTYILCLNYFKMNSNILISLNFSLEMKNFHIINLNSFQMAWYIKNACIFSIFICITWIYIKSRFWILDHRYTNGYLSILNYINIYLSIFI